MTRLSFVRIKGFSEYKAVFVEPIPSYVEVYTLSMVGCRIKALPYKIDEVMGTADLRSNELKDFTNMPAKCQRLELSNNFITSLCGIHKHIKRCGEINLMANSITSGGIGLIFIVDLTCVIYKFPGGSSIFSYLDPNPIKPRVEQALDIIGKYFRTGYDGLLACQTELIEAGLDEFALL